MGFGQCRFHGGLTPNAQKNAAAAQIEDEARHQLGLEGWEAIGDPFSALADLAGKAVALQEIMHAKVENLATLRQEGGVTGERVDLIYEAWERSFDRSLRVLQSMAKLDLTDRIARMHAAVDAATHDLVRSALEGALERAPLTEPQRVDVLREFGARLRGEKVPPELGR